MGFTTPCFIRKNTPELRKKLEELGYTYIQNGSSEWFIPIEELYYLVTYPTSGYYQGCNGYWYEDNIDCGTNEELFLALAALRDDTDVNQWFVMDVEEYMYINQGDWFLATDRNKGKHIGTQIDPMCCHKATVEEIIAHFNNQ
jgi:hypothetical protein